MRISTSQLFDVGSGRITQQQGDLVHLQNQLSTGKRVVTPADDPVAAARALEVSQASAQVAMNQDAQGDANDTLSMLDSKLGAIGDIMTYIRERAIQAGTATLNQSDRNSIAADIQAQFENLMSIGNTTDANGEYIFAGFKGDTQPFTGNSIAGVTYAGDQGQRTVHVSATRNIPVSLSGDEVFMRFQNAGNAFAAQGSLGNTGTGTVSSTATVGTYAGGQYGIKFTSATNYSVFNRATDPGMTGAPMATGTYTAGSPIALPPAPATAEITVTLNGAPATGDTFSVNPGSGTTDVFTVLKNFITNLQTGTGPAYYQAIQDTMSLASNAQDNVLRLRAQVGSQQTEIESLKGISGDLSVQYADRENRLTGLDYASAISDYQLQQSYLEASRSTFVKTSNLSLFNLL